MSNIDRDKIIRELSEKLPVVGYRKDLKSFDIICGYQHQKEYRLTMERYQDYKIDELVHELRVAFNLAGEDS